MILTTRMFGDVCDLLNQDQDLANEYILFKLEDAASDDGRLALLYNSRACFRYALEELKSFQQDPTTGWAPTCCGDPYNRSVEENIKIYESALNAVDCAICHIQETQELTCSTNEEVAPKIARKILLPDKL
ncbi:MAG: hypothetical protein IPM81_14305 [Saprospirales bacterium]|nr:hypothetical protein [Saprospirales bacterium]